MKVKALARLSTAQGWKAAGDEFTVNATEAEELIVRGLVERSDSDPVADPEPAQKVSKPTKPKA